MKEKRGAAGRRHECGPGCPGQNGPMPPERAAEIVANHEPQLRARLDGQLERRKPATAGRRPVWWWEVDDAAVAYREQPDRWQRPWMIEAAQVPAATDPPSSRTVTSPSRLDELRHQYFLAATGQLQKWEVEVLLGTTTAPSARAVREGLASRSGNRPV